MSFVLVLGLDGLLRQWKLMPDAPPSEYSRWSCDKNRHHPFTRQEIARMKSTLARIAPSTYADHFADGHLLVPSRGS